VIIGVDKIIDIDNKAEFSIGILTLVWGAIFDIVNVIVASHF
jgi:hypothetical protein